jgi:3-phosphoshikimate 1-carboxyvinyltransferase
VRGRLRVPASKSLTNRYLNLALLGRAPLVLEHPLRSEDTHLFLEALKRCGFQVGEEGESVRLKPGPPPAGEVEIFCGASGTMLRFLVAALAALPGRWHLDGIPRLRERPVRPLVDALRRLGTRIDYLAAEGFVPLRIEGGTLGAGSTVLDASESSQYLSALLMAALRAPGEVIVEAEALTSEPYVDVTLGVVEAFGGRIETLGPRSWRVIPSSLAAGRVEVEGDWSAAAYPVAAAALTRGEVTLTGLLQDSRQGDREFVNLLHTMGAEVVWDGGALTVRGRDLVGIEADLSAIPDQVPTLAALGPFARGTTRIFNVAHLRIKESDRLEAMATGLRQLDASVEEGPDWLRIDGSWAEGTPVENEVRIDPRGDHRIAMSFALVGLRRPGVVITTPGVVAKSYPEFWRDFAMLTS